MGAICTAAQTADAPVVGHKNIGDVMQSDNNKDKCILRRKFPLGYILHPDPFQNSPVLDANTSGGQFVVGGLMLLNAFLSHKCVMKVNPSGLEIYWHPNKTMSVCWNEVLRLERKKILGIFPYETLYLDKPLLMDNQKPIYLTNAI